MVELNGASTKTIEGLKKKGAKVTKLAAGRHAVTFKKDEALRQEVVLGNTGEKAGSRADLMAQAHQRGIKNFRILHKEELVKVLNPKTTQEEINKIVATAVKRWKAGWGKGWSKKKKETK